MKKILGSSVLIFLLLTSSLSANATEPFLGEVRFFGYNFCPRGWASAEGQLMLISSNTALFSLYGTFYGGDGRTTFALPDLRGRVIVGKGRGPGLSSNRIGQIGGTEAVTLTQAQMPSHTHKTDLITKGNGREQGIVYTERGQASDKNAGTENTGGSKAHNNMPPYLTLNACVAVVGVFPSRN